MQEPMDEAAAMEGEVQEPMEEEVEGGAATAVRITSERLAGLKGVWRDKRAAKEAAAKEAAAAEAAAKEAEAAEAAAAAAAEAVAEAAAAAEAVAEATAEGYNWADSHWWAGAREAAATADACGFCAAWGFGGLAEAMSEHIGSKEPWRWVLGDGVVLLSGLLGAVKCAPNFARRWAPRS